MGRAGLSGKSSQDEKGKGPQNCRTLARWPWLSFFITQHEYEAAPQALGGSLHQHPRKDVPHHATQLRLCLLGLELALRLVGRSHHEFCGGAGSGGHSLHLSLRAPCG